MRVLGLLGCVCVCLISMVVQDETAPVEYVTFSSHGRSISAAVYSPRGAMATIIVLEGASPAEVSNGLTEAQFFAAHGYRVVVPDYIGAASSAEPTAANLRRWAQVVDDMLTDPRLPRSRKIGLAGQSLGASVALVAAANNARLSAVVEWSGFLPNEFFAQVLNWPPLLILHGEQDEEVPVVNARQLVRLCKLKDIDCEAPVYAGEGHVFSASAVESSNLRALNFFRTYLR
jgi:dipeptidyl aminopeptidase/acylaminoacyl peptidase